MPDSVSRTVCDVDCGRTRNTWSHFFAASNRNSADMETSVMCLSVTLAPLLRRAFYTTLMVQVHEVYQKRKRAISPKMFKAV